MKNILFILTLLLYFSKAHAADPAYLNPADPAHLNRIDVSHAYVNVNSVTSYGTAISGSKLINDNFFLTGSYLNLNSQHVNFYDDDYNFYYDDRYGDLSINTDLLGIGLGYLQHASENIDLFGSIHSFWITSNSTCSTCKYYEYDTETVNGYYINMGISSMLSDKFTLIGSIRRFIDSGFNFGDGFIYYVDATYNINEKISVSVGFSDSVFHFGDGFAYSVAATYNINEKISVSVGYGTNPHEHATTLETSLGFHF